MYSILDTGYATACYIADSYNDYALALVDRHEDGRAEADSVQRRRLAGAKGGLVQRRWRNGAQGQRCVPRGPKLAQESGETCGGDVVILVDLL